jgi:D-beta-D-heptose 7-phosphate kinase/D-beta-D-heptose 1-phosphate adenosyltransferase
MNEKKILVVGDSCLDIFKYCNVNRLCPDIPVPVLSEQTEVTNGGMAMNVYNNIISLEEQCDIVTNSNWKEITKTRFVHSGSNHTFFRADSGDIKSRIDLTLMDYDYKLIVVSDYDKGFLHVQDIEEICSNHQNVFIDSKKILGPWISKAKYIKINDVEYRRSAKHINKDIQDKLIRTKGSCGCEFRGKTYPVQKADVKDVSGAGDTFLAALVTNYLNTGDIVEGIKFANHCASEVVTRRGVNTIK